MVKKKGRAALTAAMIAIYFLIFTYVVNELVFADDPGAESSVYGAPVDDGDKPGFQESGGVDEVSEPESGEGESSEPESGEGESSEPESGEGESSEPESGEGESSEPESGEGESSEPESGEGESSEPESGEGESSEPESGEGESSEPEKTPAPVRIYGDVQNDIESALLTRINGLRRDHGLPPLQYSNQLTVASRLRAGEMAENNYFDHIRPDGNMWYTVFGERQIYPAEGYENIARSKGKCVDDWALFDAWVQSSSHYETLLMPDLTYIGIGVVYADTANGRSTYACTTFIHY